MIVQSALNGSFITVSIDANQHHDPVIALHHGLENVKDILLRCLQEVNCVKFYVVAQSRLQKNVDDEDFTTFGFRSKTKILLQDSNIDLLIEECKLKILASLDSFQQRGSGWIFTNFQFIKIHVAKYIPCAGHRYRN